MEEIEHRLITKTEVDKVATFIEHGIKLMKDPEVIEFNKETLRIVETAKKQAKKDNEKWTYLYANLINNANKVMFYLFEYNLHTPELEAEYRTLDKMDTVAQIVQSYVDERKNAEDALVNQMQVHHEARQELGVFQGVLAGKSPSKARKQQEKQQREVEQALAEQAGQNVS